MLANILTQGVEHPHTPREGDLYKEIKLFDKTFRLVYGYYENFEREGPFNDPFPIYPDLIKEPYYTAEGFPVVTAMQSICEYYDGKNDEDSTCSDCGFFQKHEDLFGLCTCPHNKRENKRC